MRCALGRILDSWICYRSTGLLEKVGYVYQTWDSKKLLPLSWCTIKIGTGVQGSIHDWPCKHMSNIVHLLQKELPALRTSLEPLSVYQPLKLLVCQPNDNQCNQRRIDIDVGHTRSSHVHLPHTPHTAVVVAWRFIEERSPMEIKHEFYCLPCMPS